MSFLKNIEIQAQSRTASAMRRVRSWQQHAAAVLRGLARDLGARRANAADPLAPAVHLRESRLSEGTGVAFPAARATGFAAGAIGCSGDGRVAF